MKFREFYDWDYVVLALILLMSILIGLYHGLQSRFGSIKSLIFRKKKQIDIPSLDLDIMSSNSNTDTAAAPEESKVKEYLTASNSMGAFPVALSLLATFFSSTALLGFPAEVYQYGAQFWISIFGMMSPAILGAYIFGPMFAKLKVLSVFEYFQVRFNSLFVRLLAMAYYLLRIFIGMGIVIYGPATSLNALTEISTSVAIIIIGATATFYTTIGGIKAVIWSDVFQLTIMFGGIIAVISKGVYDVGGFSNLWQINQQGGRLNFLDFDPNPLVRQSFWSLLFGNFISWLMPYCMDQQMVQRFASSKSMRTAQFALLLNVPGVFFLISLCSFVGLVLYANYADCDPMLFKNITQVNNPNQIVPFFVMDKFRKAPGVAGLFLGSILCASLSSVSSALNSMSAIIWQDFLKRFHYFNNLSDKKSALTTKLIACVCGVICTLLAFMIAQLGGNLVQISGSLNGALNAPLIGLFLLGTLFPFANVFGVTIGSIFGLAVGIWINLGVYFKAPSYPKLVVGNDTHCFKMNFTKFEDISSTLATPIMQFAQARGKEATNLSGFDRIYSISYALYGTVGVVTTVLVGLIVSLITWKYHSPADDSTIVYRFQKKKLTKF